MIAINCCISHSLIRSLSVLSDNCLDVGKVRVSSSS